MNANLRAARQSGRLFIAERAGRIHNGGRLRFGPDDGAPAMPQFIDPVLAFAPQSVPPADLLFYHADALPAFRGDLLLSALAARWR